MDALLKDGITRHWHSLRGRTYQLLDVLQEADLAKRLPFPESETLGYQLSCMLAMSDSIFPSLAGKDFSDHDTAFAEAKSKVTVEEFRVAFVDLSLLDRARGASSWSVDQFHLRTQPAHPSRLGGGMALDQR